MKTAILQVADSGPLESLVVMLNSVGYTCLTPSEAVKGKLRSLGCDTVVDIAGLVENWGYDPPLELGRANLWDMDTCDLYVDVKAHRNGPKVWTHWPKLRGKTLWYRINGGKPEHVVRSDGLDCGDEVNPPCPVLTPNQWYRELFAEWDETVSKIKDVATPWAYACWPPFYRWEDYQHSRDPSYHNRHRYDPPLCLIHNIEGWGYKDLIPPLAALGVRFFGRGAPDGLINHREVPVRLSKALAMVHLKSSDAPGYALYEALASGCPVICTRRLIWRNRMEDLLIPGQTCLVFDRETHDALSSQDVVECTKEVRIALDHLSVPENNQRIGEAGRARLKELMWSEYNPADVASLKAFIRRNFP